MNSLTGGKNEGLWGSLINVLPDQLCVLDDQGCIIAVNDAWARFGGGDCGLVGENYLHACSAAETMGGQDGIEAATVRLQIEDLIAGRIKEAHGEYVCRLPKSSRNFEWWARRVEGHGSWVLMVGHREITDFRRTESLLRESESRWRTLFGMSHFGLVVQGADGVIQDVNDGAVQILGLSREQLLGVRSIDPSWKCFREDGTAFPGEEHPAMVSARDGEGVRNVVMGVDRPDGQRVWLQVSSVPAIKEGRVFEVITQFEDITAQREKAQIMQRLANHDHLTGVFNRLRLLQKLDEQFERIRRHPELNCALMVIDVDFFKQVNDKYGHLVGDEVLKHIVQVLETSIRRLDILGRVGGEEFVLLLTDTRWQDAMVLARRIVERIERTPCNTCKGDLSVTVSIGMTGLMASDASAQVALDRADMAMYWVKQHGRNGVHAIDPDAPAD